MKIIDKMKNVQRRNSRAINIYTLTVYFILSILGYFAILSYFKGSFDWLIAGIISFVAISGMFLELTQKFIQKDDVRYSDKITVIYCASITMLNYISFIFIGYTVGSIFDSYEYDSPLIYLI